MLADDEVIYLKRLRCARDYFVCWPEERISRNLDSFVEGLESEKQLFRQAYGFDALKCQVVACLGGILYTLPEFKDWLRTYGEIPSPQELTKFFGVCLWNPRWEDEGPGTDKEVALRRLDRAMAALEKKGQIQ